MEPTRNGFQALCPTDQQIIDHFKCEVLRTSSRQALVNNLMPDRHMDFLRSKHILSREDCEVINCLNSQQRRASKFLDILEMKGAGAYDALCASLREEGTQTFLLTQLHQDFEQRQRRYQDLIGQRKSTQTQLSLSPPPIQPPPPFSHCHHPQGHDPTPVEHACPVFLPQTPFHPNTTDSCPGYLSQSTNINSSACSTSPLTNGSWFAEATEVGKDEGVKVIDLQKERLNVAVYLQSLTIRQEEGVKAAKTAPTPESGMTETQPDSSLERQLPTFLSSTATYGSGSSSISNPSLDQSAPSAALSTPTQDSQGSPAVKQGQHKRLDPRGSLHKIDVPGHLLPAGGSSVDASLSSVSANPSLEPTEHEDTSTDDCSMEGSSFFQSLENESLAPSSPGIGPITGTILCSVALNDQHQALGKCLCEDTGKGEEMDEAVYPKRLANNGTELCSQLNCIAAGHNTDTKIVVPPLLGPQASCEEKKSSQLCPEVSPSSEVKESAQSSAQEEDVKGKKGAVRQKEGFAFEEGVSRELRGSVCDKSGRSVSSSQC
ncbi:hypothetical protein ACOMHN_060316 [Nucella lapillus]